MLAPEHKNTFTMILKVLILCFAMLSSSFALSEVATASDSEEAVIVGKVIQEQQKANQNQQNRQHRQKISSRKLPMIWWKANLSAACRL